MRLNTGKGTFHSTISKSILTNLNGGYDMSTEKLIELAEKAGLLYERDLKLSYELKRFAELILEEVKNEANT